LRQDKKSFFARQDKKSFQSEQIFEVEKKTAKMKSVLSKDQKFFSLFFSFNFKIFAIF
jgi:hypothetical protein